MLLTSKSVARERVLDRIKSIQWSCDDRHMYSNAKLLEEHFHRLALWCTALQRWPYWPSVDMLDLFKLTVDDEVEQQEIHSQLKHACPYLGYGDKRAWDRWFHWLLVQEYAAQEHPLLPDPFEPLIRMYERGGTYYLEHTFVYVGDSGLSFVRRSPEDYFKRSFVSSLDDATLDALDR